MTKNRLNKPVSYTSDDLELLGRIIEQVTPWVRVNRLVLAERLLDLVGAVGRTVDDSEYAIVLSENQTKNHRPYERSLDAELTPFIDRYLEHYRPILLRPSISDHVWISCRGLGMSAGTISCKICEHTKRAFGHRISPHLFRDCAMTSLANENPEHVWLGMSLLHHADPRIAENHYNQALEADAVRQYQGFMTNNRRKITKRQGPMDRKSQGERRG